MKRHDFNTCITVVADTSSYAEYLTRAAGAKEEIIETAVERKAVFV